MPVPRDPALDALRMYLVMRRGAVTTLARAGELAGAAAVACVRAFADDPRLAEWRPRPRKVCLRARTAGQWREVLAEPHALAGEADGEALAALPPRRLSERGAVLERLQAMSGALEAAPARLAGDDGRDVVTVDAGLTEIPPGTVTVVALAGALPARLTSPA
jgi:hypothetical protein